MIILWTWGTAAGAAGLTCWAPAVPARKRAVTSAAVFEPNRHGACMVSPLLFWIQVLTESAELVVRGRCHVHPPLHPPTSRRRNRRSMRVNSDKKDVKGGGTNGVYCVDGVFIEKR